MKTNNIRIVRMSNTDDFTIIAKDPDSNTEIYYSVKPLTFTRAKALLMRAKGQELTPDNWTAYIKPEPAAVARAQQQLEAYGDRVF